MLSVEGNWTMFERKLCSSVMIQHLETDARLKDRKDSNPLPHLIRRQGLTVKKVSGKRQASSSDVRCRILCLYRYCKNPSCNCWHRPVCQNYKSETGCVFGKRCYFRHVEAEENPNKESKNGGANGTVALFKESIQFGCVSQDPRQGKSILWEEGTLRSNHAVKLSKGTWHQRKFGKERVHREVISMIVSFMSVVLAFPSSRKRS